MVIAVSIFSHFSWANHWYKVFEDHYYAYIPANDFKEICRPCEDVTFLENNSGLLVSFGSDFSQIEKIKRYGEPREIGSPQSKARVYAALKLHFDAPLVEGKYIPITIQIMENGRNKLLTGQDASYEEKMAIWRETAKEMRAERDNVYDLLIQYLMSLLAITFVPIVLYSLYIWVRVGFSLKD